MHTARAGHCLHVSWIVFNKGQILKKSAWLLLMNAVEHDWMWMTDRLYWFISKVSSLKSLKTDEINMKWATMARLVEEKRTPLSLSLSHDYIYITTIMFISRNNTQNIVPTSYPYLFTDRKVIYTDRQIKGPLSYSPPPPPPLVRTSSGPLIAEHWKGRMYKYVDSFPSKGVRILCRINHRQKILYDEILDL